MRIEGPDSANLFFDVHPSVLFKLGSELIEDDAQALAELAKNAFDADATTVSVEIDSVGFYDRRTGDRVLDASNETALVVQGALHVTDNGHGMTEEAVSRGWLTVSASHKRKMKERGATTQRGRTPLGDKGLGRLGVQRLGEVVRLQSAAATGAGTTRRVNAIIDWGRFADADSLSAVPIALQVSDEGVGSPGTTVSVYGLRDRDFWSASGLANLQREVSRIISPYDDSNGLSFQLKVDGNVVELRQESRRLLEGAPIYVSFEYSSGSLSVEAAVSTLTLQGLGERRAQYMALIYPDRGASYADWLLAKNANRVASLGVFHDEGSHFLRATSRFTFAETVPQHADAEDPGPFAGELGNFNLDRRQLDSDVDNLSIFDSVSERLELARALIGIRVFRDGFGIRLESDWLRLGEGQTSGGSYFGLRPANTAGYINISAAANSQLEETSSREAFRESAAFRGFNSLLKHAFSYVADVVELVRRDWPKYAAEHSASADAIAQTSPAGLAKHIRRELRATEPLLRQAADFESSFTSVERGITDLVQAHQNSIFSDAAADREASATQESLAHARRRLGELLNDADAFQRRYSSLANDLELLEAQLQQAEVQQQNIWDMVALGMSAEVVSHEVANVTERLRGRAAQMIRLLRSDNAVDTRLIGFAENVREASSEVLRQIGRLDPMLRFRRERKETVRVSVLLERVLAYYLERWGDNGLLIRTTVKNDAEVRLNPGKFAQVVDNLTLNADYWTRKANKAGLIKRGEFRIEVDFPLITFWDNGPGIDPRIAGSLFEPFVTTKPTTDGRGLGLFVVRQLLDSEGAAIELVRAPRDGVVRDAFVIDMSGVDKG